MQKQLYNNAMAEFIKNYTGDGSDLIAKFDEFVSKINTERASVQEQLNAEKSPANIRKLASEVGTNISAEEKTKLLDAAEDMFMGLFSDPSAELISMAESICPNYEQNANFIEAQKLYDNLSTSATPKADFEKIKELLDKMLKDISGEAIVSRVKSEAAKDINIDISQITAGGLHGYKNKDTYGNDDLVYLDHVIQNGEISYNHKKDGKDVQKTMDQMLEKIKTILKSQLGENYDDALVNKIFEQAQINAINNLDEAYDLQHVHTFVDLVLKEFNPLMTKALHQKQTLETVTPNFGDTSLTEGLNNHTVKYKGYYQADDGKVMLPHESNQYYQEVMDALYQKLESKYKAALGDKFNQWEFESMFRKAQLSALSIFDKNKTNSWGGSANGDRWWNTTNNLVAQTLSELDKLIQKVTKE